MRTIIGIGNPLRGEDAFGYDVIKKLEHSHQNPQVDLIYIQQLTPELCLNLLETKELIFVDATYIKGYSYGLVCPLKEDVAPSISHHISIKMLTEMLTLYGVYPKVLRFCLAVKDFEKIEKQNEYKAFINKVAQYINSLEKF